MILKTTMNAGQIRAALVGVADDVAVYIRCVDVDAEDKVVAQDALSVEATEFCNHGIYDGSEPYFWFWTSRKPTTP